MTDTESLVRQTVRENLPAGPKFWQTADEITAALLKAVPALRSPGGDGELVTALRDMPCIRPCNGRPDDFTVGQCVDAGECGCGNAAALSAAEATSALTPAPVSGDLKRLVQRAMDNAGTMPAKDAVKLRPSDWRAICDHVLRTPHVAPGEFSEVFAEIERAVAKFPTWPTDPLHAVAIIGEEAGELVKAVLQAVYEPHKSTPEDVREEVVQTAAMALRFLLSLSVYRYERGEQHTQPRLTASKDGKNE
jgi:NTP pyrophosphatase (non-canonical NTP hydrolase)